MTQSLYLIFYFFTILLTGYAIVSLILNGKTRSFFETISLTMLLGAGAISVIFFWLSLFGFKPTRIIISFVFVAAIGSLLFLKRSKKLALFSLPSKIEKNEILVFSICGLILFCFFCIIVIDALMMPLYDVDAYALWCFKAKAIYFEGLIEGGLFYQLPLSYSHLNYPLLVPFLISGVYASIGGPDDMLGKIVFPFVCLGGMMFIFSSLRWRLTRAPAFLLTVLFFTMPAFIRWCSAGIADMPLTIFYAASVFYLVKYLTEEQFEDLVLSIFMTFFCAFVKNEGMAIAGLNIMVLVTFNLFPHFSMRKFKTAIIYTIALALLLTPWFIWSNGIPRTHENYPLRIMEFMHVENLRRLWQIFTIFTDNMLNFKRWGFLWVILPVAGILNFKMIRRKHVLAMWALLVLQIVAYVFVFIISPWTPDFLAKMALERILLHVTPAVIYLIAFYMGEHRDAKEEVVER